MRGVLRTNSTEFKVVLEESLNLSIFRKFSDIVTLSGDVDNAKHRKDLCCCN